MDIYNLSKKDIFKKPNLDNIDKIDFFEQYSDSGIYDENNYNNRPIHDKFYEDYSIEPETDNFNEMIKKNKEQLEKEIRENIGEISIKKDPRITKYEDTYSLTPYATYLITPLSDMDEDDIISRFDNCYGEWITNKNQNCEDNKPCKKIKQKFYINNLGYTGEHCRDEDGRRLRDGDKKHIRCNENNNIKCSGHGICKNTDKCICDEEYDGSNCEIKK